LADAWIPAIDQAELDAPVDEAHALKLKTAAHAHAMKAQSAQVLRESTH